jgi:hypothetical protein
MKVTTKPVSITLPKSALPTDFEITLPSLQEKPPLLGVLFIDFSDTQFPCFGSDQL